jgi:hypothetical protein
MRLTRAEKWSILTCIQAGTQVACALPHLSSGFRQKVLAIVTLLVYPE